MDSKKIARINELYKKQKEGILTESEREEQAVLRLGYIEAIRANIRNTLDHTSIQEPDGSILFINCAGRTLLDE